VATKTAWMHSLLHDLLSDTVTTNRRSGICVTRKLSITRGGLDRGIRSNSSGSSYVITE